MELPFRIEKPGLLPLFDAVKGRDIGDFLHGAMLEATVKTGFKHPICRGQYSTPEERKRAEMERSRDWAEGVPAGMGRSG
jgi:hypothetical protein